MQNPANMIDIIGHGPSMHFRIDGPDHLHGLWLQLKHRLLGKMEKILSAENRQKYVVLKKLSVKFWKLFRRAKNDRLLHF